MLSSVLTTRWSRKSRNLPLSRFISDSASCTTYKCIHWGTPFNWLMKCTLRIDPTIFCFAISHLIHAQCINMHPINAGKNLSYYYPHSRDCSLSQYLTHILAVNHDWAVISVGKPTGIPGENHRLTPSYCQPSHVGQPCSGGSTCYAETSEESISGLISE